MEKKKLPITYLSRDIYNTSRDFPCPQILTILPFLMAVFLYRKVLTSL